MRDPHGGICLVDVLATGAAGPVGVDLQIILIDLNLPHVLNHRRHLNTSEARLAAVGRVER